MKIQSVASVAVGLAAIAGAAYAAGPKRESSTAKTEHATIKSLETDLPPIEVSFNPKELTIDKPVPWAVDPSGTEADPVLRFIGPAPRALEVPLIMADKVDVRPLVELLMKLALVDEGKRRPPMLTFTWGNFTFNGVIERLTHKYTLFSGSGTPVRARVTLRVRETSRPTTACTEDSDCPNGWSCVHLTCQAP